MMKLQDPNGEYSERKYTIEGLEKLTHLVMPEGDGHGKKDKKGKH